MGVKDKNRSMLALCVYRVVCQGWCRHSAAAPPPPSSFSPGQSLRGRQQTHLQPPLLASGLPTECRTSCKQSSRLAGSSAIKWYYCSCNLHPSFSSLLLFSSSPLESGRSVVSSSPAQPSAHSCQTYCRKRRICYRDSDLKTNLLSKCSLLFISSSFICFIQKVPWV